MSSIDKTLGTTSSRHVSDDAQSDTGDRFSLQQRCVKARGNERVHDQGVSCRTVGCSTPDEPKLDWRGSDVQDRAGAGIARRRKREKEPLEGNTAMVAMQPFDSARHVVTTAHRRFLSERGQVPARGKGSAGVSIGKAGSLSLRQDPNSRAKAESDKVTPASLHARYVGERGRVPTDGGMGVSDSGGEQRATSIREEPTLQAKPDTYKAMAVPPRRAASVGERHRVPAGVSPLGGPARDERAVAWSSRVLDTRAVEIDHPDDPAGDWRDDRPASKAGTRSEGEREALNGRSNHVSIHASTSSAHLSSDRQLGWGAGRQADARSSVPQEHGKPSQMSDEASASTRSNRATTRTIRYHFKTWAGQPGVDVQSNPDSSTDGVTVSTSDDAVAQVLERGADGLPVSVVKVRGDGDDGESSRRRRVQPMQEGD